MRRRRTRRKQRTRTHGKTANAEEKENEREWIRRMVGEEEEARRVLSSGILCLVVQLKINRRFGGTFLLRLQGRRISETRSIQTLLPSSYWFLTCLTLQPWKWWRYVPLKRRLTFNWTTRRYIPEDRTLHNLLCENLGSHKKKRAETDDIRVCTLRIHANQQKVCHEMRNWCTKPVTLCSGACNC
jgi:hypothetical protein